MVSTMSRKVSALARGSEEPFIPGQGGEPALGRAQPQPQEVRVDRLHQPVVGSGVHQGLQAGRGAVPGHGQDDPLLVVRQGARPAADLDGLGGVRPPEDQKGMGLGPQALQGLGGSSVTSSPCPRARSASSRAAWQTDASFRSSARIRASASDRVNQESQESSPKYIRFRELRHPMLERNGLPRTATVEQTTESRILMLFRTAVRCAGALAVLLLAGGAVSAQRAERGFPLIQAYVPTHPEVESQSFDIAFDPRGVLYVANVSGVVVYDGAWWQLLEIGEARSAFSVASDASGRIGVGGIDDLGYLRADASGTLRFVSLRGLLPAAQRELGQVMRVHPTSRGFVYLTTRWLLDWDGKSLRTVATFPGDRPYTMTFGVEGTVLVWTREGGLFRLTGRTLQPVPGGDVFRGRRINALLPAGRDDLLVSVRGEGLFRFRNGKAEPFAPEASAWTAEHRLLNGRRLDDGRWALGSVLGGVLLLRPDGAIDQVIDTSVGLSDDFVAGVTVDREGSLWLALNNGLARVEVTSPLSVIDVRSGLKGSVVDVTRHRGEVWAATSAGLFRSGTGSGPLRMIPVPGVVSAWSLLPKGDDLLVGTAFGIFVIRDGAPPREIPGTDLRTAYVLAPSADPDRVWVGTGDGLSVLRRDPGGWRSEGMVEGVPREVRAVVERPGAVWCGTRLDGIVKVELPRRIVRRIPDSKEAIPFLVAGRLVAVQRKRVLRIDEARAELAEDPGLAGLGGMSFLAEDAEGNLWFDTRPPSVALRRLQGGGWDGLREIDGVPMRTLVTIVPEQDGVVWLAGDAGLYRYAGKLPPQGQALAGSEPGAGDRGREGSSSAGRPEPFRPRPSWLPTCGGCASSSLRTPSAPGSAIRPGSIPWTRAGETRGPSLSPS